MKIELKGIVQYYDQGHKYLEVVVAEGPSQANVKHRVGVDIEASRGKIIAFLAAMYDVKPGDIVWPRHIKVPDNEIGTSPSL